MFQIQTLIHKLEVDNSARYVKFAVLPILLLALFVCYDFRGSKNLTAPEAMDAAQLARNLSEHKGYTTQFIRPLSIYLLEKKYADEHGPRPLGDMTDRAQVRSPHPDLQNAPVYPLVLAGLMKVIHPLRYKPATPAPVKILGKTVNLWSSGGRFWIYPPDFWIGVFNQVLFLGLAVMVFVIARRWFDSSVAWMSAVVFLGTELFWRFSVSGLSTMLLMVIFLALSWVLTTLEENTREGKLPPSRQYWLAGLAGALTALAFLTRYSCGWLIIPVILFLALFLGSNRLLICVTALALFVALVSPWVARNYRVSHTLFGTAGFAIYEGTGEIADYQLQRSLHPQELHMHPLTKLNSHLREILQDELPKLGGSWIGAFFLVGLLIGFQNPTLSRLRYFLLFCLPVLVIAQALSRTQISEDYPMVNSENFLVLTAPLVIIFGVSLFFSLLERIQFPLPQLRYPVLGAFAGILCLPAIISFLTILNPFAYRAIAVAYPPYSPPLIQQIALWLEPGEMMMSDIPWAMAWYGRQTSMWLTLNSSTDFYEINDYEKPIEALYFTSMTMDDRFLTQWIHGPKQNWGALIYSGNLPANFPLTHAPYGFMPDQFFLADRDRWTGAPNILNLLPVPRGATNTNAAQSPVEKPAEKPAEKSK